MKTLSIEYPDDLDLALDANADRFAAEARVLLAYKLFELGRLTSGQAARFAGMPRALFLLHSQNYGVPSVTWDRDELAAEGLPLGWAKRKSEEQTTPGDLTISRSRLLGKEVGNHG